MSSSTMLYAGSAAGLASSSCQSGRQATGLSWSFSRACLLHLVLVPSQLRLSLEAFLLPLQVGLGDRKGAGGEQREEASVGEETPMTHAVAVGVCLHAHCLNV